MKYPKSVFCIISNEFCERFAYYGMRTVLPFYFVDMLRYSQTNATVLYHAFGMLAYFCPLIGAMIADTWLGKYRTILYLSMVYAMGELLLCISSVPSFGLPMATFSLIGLLLISMGTGGIKPCVAAFGGDQFKLPEQEAYLASFFSLFYVSINVGALLTTFITPILRKDVTCYGLNTCYPLAFLVPAVLMIVSIVIFFAGKRTYVIKKPTGNIVLKVVNCAFHAIRRKKQCKGSREHWLDYADDEYEISLIDDIKSVLKVLKLFIPIPIFWALMDQQGSRWTFQASNMNGEVFGYIIKPDQFHIVNPIFVVFAVPVFHVAVYPFMEKYLFINTPLRKIALGGFFISMGMVASGFVEMELEKTYAVKPSPGLAQIRIFNTLNCNATIHLNEYKYQLDALDLYQNVSVPVNRTQNYRFKAEFVDCPFTASQNYTIENTLEAHEATALSWFLTKEGITMGSYWDLESNKMVSNDEIKKSPSGDPTLRTLIYLDTSDRKNLTLNIDSSKDHYSFKVTNNTQFSSFTPVNHNPYKLTLNDKVIAEDVFPRLGGVYTLVGYVSDTQQFVKLVTVVEPNSIHMLWLLPQFIIMAIGEILANVTGLEFAYSQAPVNMKSLLQASWLFTMAVGNLIVTVIAGAHFFDRQVFEFLLFAAIMIADIIVFGLMARNYVYADPNQYSIKDIQMQTKRLISGDDTESQKQ